MGERKIEAGGRGNSLPALGNRRESNSDFDFVLLLSLFASLPAG
jgi:hypothetical protein